MKRFIMLSSVVLLPWNCTVSIGNHRIGFPSTCFHCGHRIRMISAACSLSLNVNVLPSLEPHLSHIFSWPLRHV